MKNLKLFRLGFATALLGASLVFVGCDKDDAGSEPIKKEPRKWTDFEGPISSLLSFDVNNFARGVVIPIKLSGAAYTVASVDEFLQKMSDASQEGEGYKVSLILQPKLLAINGYQFKENNVLTEISFPYDTRRIEPDLLEKCHALNTIHCFSCTYIDWSKFGNVTIDQPALRCDELSSYARNANDDDTVVFRFGLEGFDWEILKENSGRLNSPAQSKIVLPEGLTEIEPYAFSGRRKVCEVDIPSTVKTIGSCAFQGTGIESIVIPEGVSYVSYSAFEESQIKEIIFPASVTNWSDYEFKDGHLVKIKLPEGITEIPDYSFENCNGLEEFVVPDGVTRIGAGAFNLCKKLKSVTIPEGVTVIDDKAFKDCEGLTSIKLPSTLKSIGAYAFYLCYKMESVTIPEGVTEIGDHAFWNCEGLTSIKLPSTLKTIGRTAFGNCGFKEIVIPEGVTEIKSFTFQICEKLETVTLPKSLEVMEDNVFTMSDKIKAIYCSQAIYDKYHDKYPKMVVREYLDF